MCIIMTLLLLNSDILDLPIVYLKTINWSVLIIFLIKQPIFNKDLDQGTFTINITCCGNVQFTGRIVYRLEDTDFISNPITKSF